MTRLVRAVVDTSALRSNLGAIRRVAPQSKVMAVVKANAYGHGLVPTALALAEADAFAVARIEEGIALRSAGIDQPIVLLEGVFTREQLLEAARHSFDLVVHDPLQLELLEAFKSAHRFILWLKIDTGMNRLGFRAEDFGKTFDRLQRLPNKPLEIRLLTHLARADEHDAAMTRDQVHIFQSLAKQSSLVTSIGNSAGLLGWPEACGDWVRPGLALYGVSPFVRERADAFGLTPAMTLETTAIAIRHVPKGESVGYGGAWRATQDSTVAILAGGYGDGLPRSLENGTPVLVNGQRVPLVGRVSMDMIAVDVTNLTDVRVGVRCVLWGDGLDVAEIAAHAGTIPYELLCGVSQRVALELK